MFFLIQGEADENRLVQVIIGSDTITYAYDPLGRRIAKSVNNVVTWYVYDGNAILAAYDLSGTVTARYAHGLNIDEPLAVQQGSVTSFYHADGLGSIVALTNAAGSVVQTYSYDAFGNITPSGGINQPYTYTAREYDNETGLYYYRARYYDPKAGRFITRDPIGFGGNDINLYVYVSNNPVNWSDPSGELFPVALIPWVAWGLVGTTVAQATFPYLWDVFSNFTKEPGSPRGTNRPGLPGPQSESPCPIEEERPPISTTPPPTRGLPPGFYIPPRAGK